MLSAVRNAVRPAMTMARASRCASTESAASSPAPRAQYAVDREAYKRRMTEMRRQYLAERAALTTAPQQPVEGSEQLTRQRSQEAAARAAEKKRAREVRRKNSEMLAALRAEVKASRATISAMRRKERDAMVESRRTNTIRRESAKCESYLTSQADVSDFISRSLEREIDYDMEVARPQAMARIAATGSA